MSQDSSKQFSDSDVKLKITRSPKTSTLNFIRQFARTRVMLNGTHFNQFSVN